MRIKSFQLENYKSFFDSGLHELAPHMNVIVGQNNSGKTSLLQALSHRMPGRPHRNSDMRPDQADNPVSGMVFNFTVSGEEIRNGALNGNWTLDIPIIGAWPESPEQAMNEFFEIPEIIVSAQYQATRNAGLGWYLPKYPSHNVFKDRADEQRCLRIEVSNNTVLKPSIASGGGDNFGIHAAQLLQARTYHFEAQRRPDTICGHGVSTQLSPNASNLAEVLNVLQERPTAYRKLMEQVRRVLPLIKWVGVRPANISQIEIRIWNVEEGADRPDLAVPLIEAGTGIGQVLAILYVVMQSSDNIIIIDEPNSFLHPGAAKTLMSILLEYPHHQFIVSTHSPEIIVSAQPERLFTLKLDGERTSIQEADRNDVESARQLLNEIGSRFSDVFGFDGVVWVEGPTEVDCFPMLLNRDGKRIAPGIGIARLANTDDLQGKHAVIIAEAYRHLSAAGSVLPANVAVSLDGDKANTRAADLARRAFGGVVHFLPRQNYESFLIQPDALTALLNTLPTYEAVPLRPDRVIDWITSNGRKTIYNASDFEPLSREWMCMVDGSRLLEDLFESISDTKETFFKPRYSIALTRWLLDNDPDALKDLRTYVVSILPVA